MNPELSIVLPAYNEAKRLPPYLLAVDDYLRRSDVAGYEIIVVDDGSRDGLGEILASLTAERPAVTVVTLQENRGKGAAVRTGVLAASGRLILFADADGATPIEEERKLRRRILEGADLAVGLRRAGGAAAQRSLPRRLSGLVFSHLIRSLFRIKASDTQCGFKMFRREVGRRLFEACAEDGYLFDIYILALAERCGYRTAEEPTRWAEVGGSKVRLFRDSCRMLAGIPRLHRALRSPAPEPPTLSNHPRIARATLGPPTVELSDPTERRNDRHPG